MIEELRNKDQLTRQDIAKLLESIGAPGKNRAEKKRAVIALNRISPQGYGLEYDVESYAQW